MLVARVGEHLDVEPLYELKEFMWPLSFHGTIYPAKAPLVALQEGLGLDRNDAAYRRFMGLAQTAIGPGDPAIWSERISQRRRILILP